MIAVTVQQNPIAVALIEPKPLLRDALQALVNADTRLTVVAAVSNAAELMSRAQHSRVDVALVALDADTDGHAAMLTAILGGVSPPCRILVVTHDASPGFRVCLIERGVKGVVLTHQTGDVLRRAIMRVHEG